MSIEVIQEKYPEATMQARRDFALIQKQRVVEPAYWFRNTETGEEYHGLYAGIGWPQRVTEKGDQLPGYAVIVAVTKGQGVAEDAAFKIVEEIESLSVDLLIQKCIKLRARWGFGVHPHLMRVFLGDYRQFEMVVANYNARVIESDGDDRQAFIVSPPDDFDNLQAFDIFVRRLQSVLTAKAKRLYLGDHEIIKNRILSFRRDDPAIMALGGLVHALLLRTPWMEQSTPSVFQLLED